MKKPTSAILFVFELKQLIIRLSNQRFDSHVTQLPDWNAYFRGMGYLLVDYSIPNLSQSHLIFGLSTYKQKNIKVT